MKDKRNFKDEQLPEGMFIGKNAVRELLRSERSVDKLYIRSDSEDSAERGTYRRIQGYLKLRT